MNPVSSYEHTSDNIMDKTFKLKSNLWSRTLNSAFLAFAFYY